MTAESYGLQVWHVQPSVMPTAHYHNEIEVIVMEQGRLAYMMNAHPLTLTAGDVFVFWASIPHQLTGVLDACAMQIITVPLPVFFKWGLRDNFVADIMRGHPVVLKPAPTLLQQIRLYTQQWAQDLKLRTDDNRETVHLELHALLHRLSRSYRPERGIAEAVDTQVSPKQVQARRIAHTIATHYTEPITLAEIAASVGLHPSYVSSLFAEVFDYSVWEYLTQHRVAHAQRLLLLTDKRVAQVAAEAGFTSVSQFYAIFKRYADVPPQQFRALSRL